jgi:hypothetical protein
LLYGTMLRKREEAEGGDSKGEKPPGVRPLTDALAALVPAEVLAIHAAVVSDQITTASNEAGELVTTIKDPTVLKVTFVVLLLASMVLYRFGLQQKVLQFDRYESVGLFIPPVAFFLWTLLQEPSAFDAWWGGALEGYRLLIVLVFGSILVLIAQRLGAKVDQNPKKR